MPRALLVATLAATSCATLRPECAAHGGDPWLQLTSMHFDVKTNLTAGEGRAATLKLERWLAVLEHVFPGTGKPPGRMEVVLFRDTREMQELTGSTSMTGHQTRDWHGPMMLLGNTLYVFETVTEDAVVLHELTHYLERYAFARQPRWLAEGLAKYFESAKVDETGAARIGDPLISELKAMRSHSPLPLDALWDWDTDQRNPDDDRDLTSDRYATSWMFVHFLYNRREQQLRKFLQGLAQGTEPRAAFLAAFEGVTPKRLESEAQTYVEAGKYRAQLFTIQPINEYVDQQPLPDATAHALFARISLAVRYSPEWKARAEEELKTALELDAYDPLALELKVLTATGQPALENALALMKAHPARASAWRLAASQLARAGDMEGALESLQKASSIEPDSPDVLRELGGLLEAMGRPAEALPMVARAAQLAPHRYELKLTLALMLARANRCDEATAAFVRAGELLDEKMDRRVFLERSRPYLERCAPN